MTARELLAEFRAAGFDFVRRPDGKWYPERKSKTPCRFPPALMAELTACRAEVIDLLENPPGEFCAPCRSWVTAFGLGCVGETCGKRDCPYRGQWSGPDGLLYVDFDYVAAERHVAMADRHDTRRKSMVEELPGIIKAVDLKRKSRAKGYRPLFGGDGDEW